MTLLQSMPVDSLSTGAGVVREAVAAAGGAAAASAAMYALAAGLDAQRATCYRELASKA